MAEVSGQRAPMAAALGTDCRHTRPFPDSFLLERPHPVVDPYQVSLKPSASQSKWLRSRPRVLARTKLKTEKEKPITNNQSRIIFPTSELSPTRMDPMSNVTRTTESASHEGRCRDSRSVFTVEVVSCAQPEESRTIRVLPVYGA